jgi:hypothetical protein
MLKNFVFHQKSSSISFGTRQQFQQGFDAFQPKTNSFLHQNDGFGTIFDGAFAKPMGARGQISKSQILLKSEQPSTATTLQNFCRDADFRPKSHA